MPARPPLTAASPFPGASLGGANGPCARVPLGCRRMRNSSIAAQIAGAFYGVQAIDARWREDLWRWDGGEIALRAILLALLNEPTVTVPLSVGETQ